MKNLVLPSWALRLASGPPTEVSPAPHRAGLLPRFALAQQPPRQPRPTPRPRSPALARLRPGAGRSRSPRGATRRRAPDRAATRHGLPDAAGRVLSTPRAHRIPAFAHSRPRCLLLSPRARHRHRAPRLAGARSPAHLSSPVTTPSSLQLRRHPAHPVLSLLCSGKHPVLGNCSPEHGRARW